MVIARVSVRPSLRRFLHAERRVSQTARLAAAARESPPGAETSAAAAAAAVRDLVMKRREALDLVVPFKRTVYRAVLKEFADLVS